MGPSTMRLRESSPFDMVIQDTQLNHRSIDPATKTRSWAATAYLPPKVRARANLTILTDTLATKVVLEPDEASGDGYKAKGVKVISHDVESGASGARERIILARGEVVLAAGALHTPQLLELSGIGGSELLERFQIPVVVDNPHVGELCHELSSQPKGRVDTDSRTGEHLQDHPGVCMGFEVADGVFSGDMMRDPNVLQALIEQYQANGAGPLGQSVIKSTAYVPSKWLSVYMNCILHKSLSFADILCPICSS